MDKHQALSTLADYNDNRLVILFESEKHIIKNKHFSLPIIMIFFVIDNENN